MLKMFATGSCALLVAATVALGSEDAFYAVGPGAGWDADRAAAEIAGTATLSPHGEPLVLWGAAGGSGMEVGVSAGALYNDGDPDIKDMGLEVSLYAEKRVLGLLGLQLRGFYTIQDVDNPTAGIGEITGWTIAGFAKVVLNVPDTGIEVYGGAGIGYRIDDSDLNLVLQDIDDSEVYLLAAGATYKLGDQFRVGVEAGYQLAEPDVNLVLGGTDIDLDAVTVRGTLSILF